MITPIAYTVNHTWAIRRLVDPRRLFKISSIKTGAVAHIQCTSNPKMITLLFDLNGQEHTRLERAEAHFFSRSFRLRACASYLRWLMALHLPILILVMRPPCTHTALTSRHDTDTIAPFTPMHHFPASWAPASERTTEQNAVGMAQELTHRHNSRHRIVCIRSQRPIDIAFCLIRVEALELGHGAVLVFPNPVRVTKHIVRMLMAVLRGLNQPRRGLDVVLVQDGLCEHLFQDAADSIPGALPMTFPYMHVCVCVRTSVDVQVPGGGSLPDGPGRGGSGWHMQHVHACERV